MSDMKWRNVKPVGRREWWLFVKFMFGPVLIFLLIIGNLIAYVATQDSKFLIIALLWLIISKLDGVEDRVRNGR